MIGLLTMRSLVEGSIHLTAIIVGDHRLIMIVLIVDLTGNTMTTAVVVHQAAMKTTRMRLKSRPAQTSLLVEIAVTLIIVCSVKMCAVPLKVVTTITHLNGNKLVNGMMTLPLATRALMLTRVMTGK
jgi:hypothetical protein